jgi:Flp pilus assembly protein CpaB
MMRGLIYTLAALFAFGTAFYYYQDVSAKTATVSKLRLASEDGLVIGEGTTIDDEFLSTMLVSQRIPAALAEDFRWALDDTPTIRANLRGEVFTRDVPGGAFLDRTLFFASSEGAFVRRIREGHRAFSIPVAADRAVENFIAPGSRVDIMGTFELPGDLLETRVLLENVEIMAVGTFATRGDYERAEAPGYSSVTLQATTEAIRVFLGEAEAAMGDLVLVLRNPCEDASDCVGGEIVSGVNQ